MEHSPFSYQFTPNDSEATAYAPHEVLQLQPLEFIGKGGLRTDGTVRLQRAGFNADDTIGNFFYCRRCFALIAHALEGQQFVINFSEPHSSLNEVRADVFLLTSSRTNVSARRAGRFPRPRLNSSSPYLHLPQGIPFVFF